MVYYGVGESIICTMSCLPGGAKADLLLDGKLVFLFCSDFEWPGKEDGTHYRKQHPF